MFFPTWLDMVLMLISFMWITLQQRFVQSESTSITRLVMAGCFIVFMLVVVLYNKGAPWLSTAFFVLSVVSLGLTFHMYRQMPSRLPEEPKF
jgi:Na+/proline symporter